MDIMALLKGLGIGGGDGLPVAADNVMGPWPKNTWSNTPVPEDPMKSLDLSLAAPVLAGLMGVKKEDKTVAPTSTGQVSLHGGNVPVTSLPTMNPISLRQRLTGGQ
jgi:hypothetical protein